MNLLNRILMKKKEKDYQKKNHANKEPKPLSPKKIIKQNKCNHGANHSKYQCFYLYYKLNDEKLSKIQTYFSKLSNIERKYMIARNIFIIPPNNKSKRYQISKNYQYKIFNDGAHYLVCIQTLQYFFGIGSKIIHSIKIQMQQNGNNTGLYSFKPTKYNIKPKQWLINSEKTELENCTHTERHYVKKSPNSKRISRELKDGKVFKQWKLYLEFQKTYHPDAYNYWLLKQNGKNKKEKKNKN